ncbi:MAG TPA: carboxypeptidase-like regulatory domain-containing protein, partial [Puia sp.]|nr:carboxypeptidase-like regulatory domain-containing protein [Puia sp.]
MSDQEKNKIQYNASDIIKYLKGELSPLEMHAMEKAALDDPLLADALDGMQQSFENDQLQKFPADILEIRNRLSRRIGQQKIPNPSPFIFGWKVAAAVLVILFAGGLTVYMINQQKAGVQTLARSVDTASKTKADSTVLNSQPAASIAEPEKKSTADAEVKKTEQASSSIARSEKKHKPVHHAPKTVLPDTAFEGAALIDKKNDVAKNSLSPNTLTEKQVTAPAAHFDYKNRATNLSSFYGKVTDEHNKPIASAFIASKDKKVQALTDNNGNFKLNIGKQDTVISVEISSSGYDPAFITLNTHGVPNIVMLRETSSSGGAY